MALSEAQKKQLQDAKDATATPAPPARYQGPGWLSTRIGTPAEPRERTAELITVEPFTGGEDTYEDVGGVLSFEGDMAAGQVVLNAMKAISRTRINVLPQPNNRPGGEETRFRFRVSFHTPA